MKYRLVMQIGLALAVLVGLSGGADAADKVKTVASFSILGDMVRQVGGDRVEVVTLVGPDGDAHVFSPTPADAKTLAGAEIFFVNGLGFEGWMERLEKSSGFPGKTVVASQGVKPLTMSEEEGHHHGEEAKDEHEHEDHAKGEDHDDEAEEVTDPHAWQDLANGKIYVANIRDGLIAADPDGKAIYEANAVTYLDAIAKEEEAVKQALAALPEARRKIITSHDAFGYFGAAYGLEIVAPEGVSTESEASAQDVAKIIRQIKAEKIPAVFLENVTDHRLLDQIARETGAKIGGTLYSDALSGPDGPAPTYLDMFRHNVGTLTAALSS
ncbi:MAG TPA: metal ABC transporter substrate-binding protein [Methyloceanibacter sp.]|nr:metal ABC transporter substrate-binding protein [Methyloceanibacter sp.]